MIKINGVTIAKMPSKMRVVESDVDGETTRNAKGELIRDRVAVKKKIELEFPPMKQSEISALLKSVKDVYFTVEFLDPMDGIVTKTMYVGDRTAPMYKHGAGGSQVLWEKLSMNFVEK